ncbi:MAG TPA: hypothetical protein VFH48_05565, partial [Chloroflexota bacterium]|nr:hypothetical protein [Chloroflexota bacterium]
MVGQTNVPDRAKPSRAYVIELTHQSTNQQRARGWNPVIGGPTGPVVTGSWPRWGRRLDGLQDELGRGLGLGQERDV